MKKNLFVLIFLGFVLFSGLFVSCDFLLPAPLGRNNPFDDEAQIGQFNGAVAGLDTILTVWDWRNPVSGINDSRIIDKIRIVHKENNPPDTKYPVNPDNVIEFDSNLVWQYGWNGLNADREHYFALYAHEKGGVWLSPKRFDIHLDNNGFEESSNFGFTKLYVDTSADTNSVFWPSSSEYVTESPLTILFLVFDNLYDSNYGIVLDARLTNYTITNTGTVDIVPVRIKVNDTMKWENISNPLFYDYEKANKNVYISGSGEELQIKDQINIAKLYGSNTVAIIPNSGSPINISVESIQFNDGVNDLFSIWRNN